MAYVPPSTRRSPARDNPAGRSVGSVSTKGGRSVGRVARPAAIAAARGRGTFLAGLGIGLAVGAAVALLLAPRSGADTRRALKRRGLGVRHKAGDAWEDLRLELARATRALRRKRRDAREAREARRAAAPETHHA